MQLSYVINKIKKTKFEKVAKFSANKKYNIHHQRKELSKKQNLKPKKSAVLLLVYNKENQATIVLIRRTIYNGTHSGQIALPGGKFESKDKTLQNTALRETKEEIGFCVSSKNIIGALTDVYVPPSNFNIKPYIAYTLKNPEFIKNPEEVDEIIEISINSLLDKKNSQLSTIKIPDSSQTIEVPCFNINENYIWGATAIILNEFLSILEK